MRTVIAMIFALAAAVFMTAMAAQNVADNIVATTRFESPQAVANAHAGIFLLTSLVGLLGGFIAGWVVGYPFRRRPPG